MCYASLSSVQDSAYEREGMCTDNHLRGLDKIGEPNITLINLYYNEV